jgi:hypothetical protein
MPHLTLALGAWGDGGPPPHHPSPPRAEEDATRPDIAPTTVPLASEELQSDGAIMTAEEVPEKELLRADDDAIMAKDEAECVRAYAALPVEQRAEDQYYEFWRHYRHCARMTQ